jgi:hypothetical protein
MLKPGVKIERYPPRPKPYDPENPVRGYPDPFEGTREWLQLDAEGRPLLERQDVWGWVPSPGARPADNLKGFNFGKE